MIFGNYQELWLAIAAPMMLLLFVLAILGIRITWQLVIILKTMAKILIEVLVIIRLIRK